MSYLVKFLSIYSLIPLLALDLLSKLVAFEPTDRISVLEALKHPYLASYHEVGDEPSCPEPFQKWRDIEELETIEQFREAIAREVEEFRREVRTLPIDEQVANGEVLLQEGAIDVIEEQEEMSESDFVGEDANVGAGAGDITQGTVPFPSSPEEVPSQSGLPTSPLPRNIIRSTDPFATYRRRTSLLSTTSAFRFTSINAPETALGSGSTDGHQRAVSAAGYFTPARSRASSTAGDGVRPLLRALSTVSIHDAIPGGLAALGLTQAGKNKDEVTAADAPPSSLPVEFKSRHPRRSMTYG